MSETGTQQAQSHATATIRPRCLLLHVEPTSYMLHRLERFHPDANFSYDVHFVTRNASQNWDLSDSGAGVVLLPKDSSVLERLRRIAKLSWDILRGHYAVAHVAGWGCASLLFFSVLLRLRGVPFTYESDTQLARVRSGFKERIKSLLYPLLFRFPTAFFPAGARQAEFFRAYRVRDQRIHIAKMTVDVDRIRSLGGVSRNDHRQHHGFERDDLIFLFAGRLEEKKGLKYLLDAFQRVKSIVGHCRLVIVGDGAMSDFVRNCAVEQAGVHYAGRQPFEVVIQWMKSCDALVLPSLVEPWGLVVNEAMACGLPIIASDRVGCVDDLVKQDINGLIVPAADSDALASAMMALCGDDDLRKRMSKASECIIAPWTLDAEANVMKQVLQSIGRLD